MHSFIIFFYSLTVLSIIPLIFFYNNNLLISSLIYIIDIFTVIFMYGLIKLQINKYIKINPIKLIISNVNRILNTSLTPNFMSMHFFNNKKKLLSLVDKLTEYSKGKVDINNVIEFIDDNKIVLLFAEIAGYAGIGEDDYYSDIIIRCCIFNFRLLLKYIHYPYSYSSIEFYGNLNKCCDRMMKIENVINDIDDIIINNKYINKKLYNDRMILIGYHYMYSNKKQYVDMILFADISVYNDNYGLMKKCKKENMFYYKLFNDLEIIYKDAKNEINNYITNSYE